MNWDFIIKYLPLYQKAAILTVKIGIAGILLAILIGLFCMAIQSYRIPVLRQVVVAYIEISRNTPLLIQLFFIYYGITVFGVYPSSKIESWKSCICCGVTSPRLISSSVKYLLIRPSTIVL